MKKLKCPHCGFVKVLGGRELRTFRKRLSGFTCTKCGKKVSPHDLAKKRGNALKPPGERRKRVKKKVVKKKPEAIVPQPYAERSEWWPRSPQPMDRTLEEAVISSLNIRVSAPIPTLNLDVNESKFETEKLDLHGDNPGETVHKRKSSFERTSDRIEQYLSGLDKAQTTKEIAGGLGMTKSLVFNTLQLMEVFGTVQKAKRGSYYFFLKGVYDDEQISAMLPPERVKLKSRSHRSRSPGRYELPVRKSFLEEHLFSMRVEAGSGEGPSALAMIGLAQQETVGENALAEELPRVEELPRELEVDLEVEESRVEALKKIEKIEPFDTVEHLPKDARQLNQMQTKYLKEQLKGLDGYGRIERFGRVFVEFSALRHKNYGNVLYFSAGTNPWERVYRVTVNDSLSLEMKEPVKRVRGWGRSIYDPIIDRFIECGHDLVEIGVEGRKPSHVASQLRKRIKNRELEIVASSVGGLVYLENRGVRIDG